MTVEPPRVMVTESPLIVTGVDSADVRGTKTVTSVWEEAAFVKRNSRIRTAPCSFSPQAPVNQPTLDPGFAVFTDQPPSPAFTTSRRLSSLASANPPLTCSAPMPGGSCQRWVTTRVRFLPLPALT